MHGIILPAMVFIFGLCLGSFINVVIYRLPKEDLSLDRPRRSSCPRCGAGIAWYDNLPLISYLALRGRCRHCRSLISFRYPLVELLAGMLTLAVYSKSGLSFRTLTEIYFVLGLIAITFIDLDEMIIPDVITFPGMALGLLAALIAPDLYQAGLMLAGRLQVWGVNNLRWISLIGSGLGLAVGWGFIWGIIKGYLMLTGREGMGGGDMTLLAMIGANLGWRSVFLSIFLGSCLALAAYLVLAVKERRFDLKTMLPFGPFLSLAALIYLFFGENIIRWYFR